MIARAFERVMCHVRSLNRPEDQETRTEAKVATRKGGQVRTRVMVVLKPRVFTTVGMKFLNPFAERWRLVIKPEDYRSQYSSII